MDRSVTELAKEVEDICKGLEGFSATEKISAGKIRAQASVRFRRPAKITLEYRSYEDPLAKFEEKLAGSEFLPEELLTMQILYNGHETWMIDAKHNVAIKKIGRRLYSPLRLPDGIADITLMYHLTRDFLLRDEGQEAIGGRDCHKIGLKPKTQQRVSLFKDEIFPVIRAVLYIDSEKLFPSRIVFWPSPRSPLYYIVGPSEPITIEYENLLLTVPKDEVFEVAISEQMKVFHEQEVPEKEISDNLPFDIPLNLLKDRGYELRDNLALITVSKKADRAYALLSFQGKESSNKQASGISLRAGNYLSPDMNRRRALLASSGEEIDLKGKKGRLLDRGLLLKDEIPESAQRSLLEVTWQQDGVYWFLLAEGIAREDLLSITTSMATGDNQSSE